MDEKKEWAYESMSLQLHKTYDRELIDEVKRRKREHGVAASKTLRNWARIGYRVETKQQ